jgi:ferredoxin
MTNIEPHHLNSAGPFFVEKDQCIACRAPEQEAPELMSFDEQGGSCYFHRQPGTPEEIEHAIQAVWVACCDAVHYGGTDSTILVAYGNSTRVSGYRGERHGGGSGRVDA